MEVISECEVRFVISFLVYSGLGDIGCHIRLLQNPLDISQSKKYFE
jgi:hypothetical protein